jgi:hypothetical protein
VSPPPSFAGTPDPVGLADWLLIEWVAGAKPGDAFPEPWCQAHDPPQTMLRRLAALGVMAPPAPGSDDATTAREASAAAARWLEQHPRPDAEPQEVPRHLGFGLAPDLAPEVFGPGGEDAEEPAAVRMRRLVLERLRQAGGSGPPGSS